MKVQIVSPFSMEGTKIKQQSERKIKLGETFSNVQKRMLKIKRIMQI